MAVSYFFLHFFSEEWGRALRSLTGFPFNIETVAHLRDQGWLFTVILLNLFASLKLNQFYRLDLFAKWPEVAFQSLKCSAIGIGMTAVFFNFFSIIVVNRSLLFGFAVAFFLYHVTKEILFRSYLLNRHYRRHPLEALLVCSASDAASRMEDFTDRRLSSVVIKGIALSEGVDSELPPPLQECVAGRIENLGAILSQGHFDFVFLGLDPSHSEESKFAISRAEEQGIDVWYFAELFAPLFSRAVIDEYGGKPVVVFNATPDYDGRFVAKRMFDLGLSILLLVLLSPLFALIAVAIKSFSRGPVIYAQARTGWRGRPFRMYKFRTMIDGAEEERTNLLDLNELKGPVYKLSEDPRLTRLGACLRRFSLDELPQLYNILKGEMSLVGPRPLPIYETQNFEAFRDHRRYSVLPGLTGLWQVSGRNEIRDFSEWVRLDLEYIDRWSLWLDIVILFRTVPAVVVGTGAK